MKLEHLKKTNANNPKLWFRYLFSEISKLRVKLMLGCFFVKNKNVSGQSAWLFLCKNQKGQG